MGPIFAVLINTLVIFIAGLLGAGLGHNFPKKYQEVIMKFLPLTIIVLGIGSALKGDTIVVIISIVLGVIIGEKLDLEGKLQAFADLLKKKFVKDSGTDFSTGFISGTLLFCVGSVGILGAIDAGVRGDYELLYTKTILDGISALFLATTLGRGMAFSAVSVLAYEGAIVLLATVLAPILSPEILENISGVGGITILAIGLNMLDLVEYKLANALPAIVIPVIIGLLGGLI